MKMKNSENDVVILSTADWDNPFWTNKQHVAMDFAKKGYKVFYVDSLGLRRPGVNKKDLKRIIKRCIKGVKPPRQVHPNIWVWSPILIPFNSKKFVRAINKLAFSVMLKFWLKVKKIKDPVLWTYNPMTTNVIDIESFKYTVYHCVDEIKAQPGMPIETLELAEKDLTKKANITFVTSPTLLESRKKWSDEVYYYSNVSDYDHFSKALLEETKIPVDLEKIAHPRLGFIGAISSYKIDFHLLSSVATSHPEWNIILIGDVGEGDPSTNISILKNHSNIHFLGPKIYSELPSYLKGFDVALLPNKINEYTDNMFPMKFFEYLSAGKNVVSVDLPSIKDFKQYVKISNSSQEFTKAIEDVLQGNVIPLDEIQKIAEEYTYSSRAKKMIELINSKES